MNAERVMSGSFSSPTGEAPSERQSAEAARAAPPPRRSPWTPKQKILRLLWQTCARPVWVVAPGLRAALIRLFGGRVGVGCRFGRDVEITIPWNVRVGSSVRVGERVILYGLGPITIGDGTVLDAAAHICAGTHDYTDPRFTLLKVPVTIGSNCYIGMDVYVGPGVTIGDGCVVHPRSSVHQSIPDGAHVRGNPARAWEEGDG